jgi:hypothetical protein
MRGSAVERGAEKLKRGVTALLALGAAAALLAPGCEGKFEGPYPCVAGYASCYPQGANGCETNITGDGANCGACAHACGLGATCTKGTCGAVPAPFVKNEDATAIAVNGTNVVWMATMISGGPLTSPLHTLPLGGGATPIAIAPQTTSGQQGVVPNATCSFALDATDAYFWGIYPSTNPMGSNMASGPAKADLKGARGSELDATGGAPAIGGSCAGGMAVHGGSVYYLEPTPQGASGTLFQLPVGGGTPKALLQVPLPSNQGGGGGSGTTPNAFITATDLFYLSSTNYPTTVQRVPLSGAPSTSFAIETSGFNATLFTADADNLYFAGTSCPCNNGSGSGTGQSSGGLPVGAVFKTPLAGGPQTQLATAGGQLWSIVVDAASVYWSSDSGVWKVPIAGGDAVQVAGDLTDAMPVLCATGCGGPPPGNPGGTTPTPVSIAVDATSLYVADPQKSVILKVPK